MLRIITDSKERLLILLAFVALALFCLVEAELPLLHLLEGTFFGELLTKEFLKSISRSVCTSLLAAYIFYVFIDLYPRIKKEEKVLYVLNCLIASVLDSYSRCRIFGHETSITNIANEDLISPAWLSTTLIQLHDNNSKFLPLKFAMQTAYTRLEDFRNSLSLAVDISPEWALQWLVIIDKVRLLAENYDEQPQVPETNDITNNAYQLNDYKSDLNLRFLEIVEEVQKWQVITVR